jgi:hypothetical protein
VAVGLGKVENPAVVRKTFTASDNSPYSSEHITDASYCLS